MSLPLLLLLANTLPCSAMNMDHGGGGVPWLSSPVMLHSSREDTCTLTSEQCAYRSGFWRYWYKADYRFALTTVYFILAMIGFFTIGNIITRVSPPSVRRNSLWQQLQAALRYIGYRGFRVRLFGWYSPSLAYLLVGLAGAVFFFGLTLGPKPYYWPNTKELSYGSSPPLATRSGWMAVALLPFIVVLAAKANWVTAVTGVSHEKLQVFHRYLSYAMFVLALVHTFPFIVFHIWKGDMPSKWKSDVVYWTGVVALIFQAYLTAMSCGPIRNRYYEFFKATHYLAALIFILFFFFHCDFRLTSWDYFIATGTLYLSSLLYSHLRTFLAYGMRHTAHLYPLADGTHLLVRIPIDPSLVARSAIPVDVAWAPGQHVFLRFFGLGWHSVSAHPFTICSLPPPSSSPSEKSFEVPELRFVIKPAGGLTRKLFALAREKPGQGVRVSLDGPYGGVGRRMGEFERVLVVAGGSGAGFTLPVVEEVLRRNAGEGVGRSGSTEVKVVVATRDVRTKDWYVGEMRVLLERYGRGAKEMPVTVSLHVTGEAAQEAEVGEAQGVVDNAGQMLCAAGRPDLPRIVREYAKDDYGSLGITVCGPAGMLYDVRNAAAEVQKDVIRGKAAREVYLHSEHFSW